eukprot:Gb_12567 [translate_table: standard]
MTAIPMEVISPPDHTKKYTSAATQRRRDIKLRQTDDQIKSLEDQLMRLKKLPIKTPRDLQSTAEKGKALATQFTSLRKIIEEKAPETKPAKDIPNVFKRLASGRNSADLFLKKEPEQPKKNADNYEEAKAKLNALVRSYNEWVSRIKEAAQDYSPDALGNSYAKHSEEPKEFLARSFKKPGEFSCLMQSGSHKLNVGNDIIINTCDPIEDQFLGNEDEEIIERHRHSSLLNDPQNYVVEFPYSRGPNKDYPTEKHVTVKPNKRRQYELNEVPLENVEDSVGIVISKIITQKQVTTTTTSNDGKMQAESRLTETSIGDLNEKATAQVQHYTEKIVVAEPTQGHKNIIHFAEILPPPPHKDMGDIFANENSSDLSDSGLSKQWRNEVDFDNFDGSPAWKCSPMGKNDIDSFKDYWDENMSIPPIHKIHSIEDLSRTFLDDQNQLQDLGKQIRVPKFESKLEEMDADLIASENSVMKVAAISNDMRSEIEMLEELLKEEPGVLENNSFIRHPHSEAHELVAMLQDISRGNLEENSPKSKVKMFASESYPVEEQPTEPKCTLEHNESQAPTVDDEGTDDRLSALECKAISGGDRMEINVSPAPESISILGNCMQYNCTEVSIGLSGGHADDHIADRDEAARKDNSITVCAMEQSGFIGSTMAIHHTASLDMGRNSPQPSPVSAEIDGSQNQKEETDDSNMEQNVEEQKDMVMSEERSDSERVEADENAMQVQSPGNIEEEASIIEFVQDVETDLNVKEVEKHISSNAIGTNDRRDIISKKQDIAVCNRQDNAEELASKRVAIHDEAKVSESLSDQQEEGSTSFIEDDRIQSAEMELEKGVEENCSVEEALASNKQGTYSAEDRVEDRFEDEDDHPRDSQDQEEATIDKSPLGVTECHPSNAKETEEKREISLHTKDIQSEAVVGTTASNMYGRLGSGFHRASTECTEAESPETTQNIDIEEKQPEDEAIEIKNFNKQSQYFVTEDVLECKRNRFEARTTTEIQIPELLDYKPKKSELLSATSTSTSPSVEAVRGNSVLSSSSSLTDSVSPEVPALTRIQTEYPLVEALKQRIQEMESQQPIMETLKHKVREMELQQEVFVKKYVDDFNKFEDKRQRLKNSARKHWIFVVLQAFFLAAGMLFAFFSDDRSLPPT